MSRISKEYPYEIDYDDLEVVTGFDYDSKAGGYSTNTMEINYTYTPDEDELIDTLIDIIEGTVDCETNKEYIDYVEDNIESLISTYKYDIIEHFREKAEREAENRW